MHNTSERTESGRAVHFPQAFLWGAATSAHQVEGENVHSDWWAWEQAGRVKEPSGAACGHYQRFAEDFDLAQRLHHNAHRFSIEWSRLEPEQGRWDEQAIAHYQQVVHALRERQIEPIATLFHSKIAGCRTPWGAEEGAHAVESAHEGGPGAFWYSRTASGWGKRRCRTL